MTLTLTVNLQITSFKMGYSLCSYKKMLLNKKMLRLFLNKFDYDKKIDILKHFKDNIYLFFCDSFINISIYLTE